jgi:hypothetical protein
VSSLRLAVILLASTASVLLVAERAGAQDLAEPAPPRASAANEWELAALVAYASPPIHGGTTPFGAGFGGRLGRGTSGLYAGLRGAYFLGGTDIDVTDRAILGGAELGWSFRVGHLVLRPLVGAGGVRVTHVDPSQGGIANGAPTGGGRRFGGGDGPDVVSGASASNGGTSVFSFWVSPALTALLVLDDFFVGADAGLLVLPSIQYAGAVPATWVSSSVGAELGLRF